MKNPDRCNSLPSRGRGLLSEKEYLLLLVLSLAHPVVGWPQNENLFSPGVKVLATLESSESAWSPNGQSLAYMRDDGIWVVESPDFQKSRRLIRKGYCA